MHPIRCRRKRRRVFLGLSSEQCGYTEQPCSTWQKIMISYILHSSLYIHLVPTEIRRCGVILQYAADRSRHTKDCAAECRISSLQRSIHKAFSWYYITAFSEPEILHKYWKSTEGCSNTNCCLSYCRQITFSQSHRYCTLLCNTMRPRPILGSITVQQSWDYVKDRWLPHWLNPYFNCMYTMSNRKTTNPLSLL